MTQTPEPSASAWLNQSCHCIRPDREALRKGLAHSQHGARWLAALDARPGLFSDTAVFLDSHDVAAMQEAVRLMSRVVLSPAFHAQALLTAPAIARQAQPNPGVFLGFDFHLTEAGPRLIEINTNAGGAMLNLVLGQAQSGCCTVLDQALARWWTGQEGQHSILAMFREEWALARGEAVLRSIAIVDESPQEQYLYPEFLLFEELFRQAGLQAFIVAPSDLEFREQRLWWGEQPIDLVYNRLTDFYLEDESLSALRQAYESQAVVLTPHPYAHALWADKRHMALLRDARLLQAAGLSAEEAAFLQAVIPPTEVVSAEQAESLWARRKGLFFKPAAGYAGKAAYRGDKLTRSNFAQLINSAYVAQAIVPPSERRIRREGEAEALRLDVRNYVYQGQTLLLAARLYQGQTTNFRTPGGGFAPVLTVSAQALLPAGDQACCTRDF